jgi:[glutamine synthetase] adenylyltransferase / [glutamine synthetase]-adenylyl-L-tyrosine phosphorylase
MTETPYAPLCERMHPCCVLKDEVAARNSIDILFESAMAQGWAQTLRRAQSALLPIIEASPYLFGLMRKDPEGLQNLLQSAPEPSLAQIFKATEALSAQEDVGLVIKGLRQLKSRLHLLCALCDLGDVWRLDQVTGALTRFADLVVTIALGAALAEERQKGRLMRNENPDIAKDRGPLPGLFILAMGKQGAGELNYSSDIDITFFADLGRLPVQEPLDRQSFADRLARRTAVILSERNADGYVFRVDLRLRPDPSSTPTVVSIPFALNYYETVGQNWERCAFIKARFVAGDATEARDFLQALSPFIWRRSLDYPAIADVQAIKRQIHVHKADERLSAPGANLKLGAGGIREIEFFVQTQQLILGGRDPNLRSRKTLEALDALRRAGHIAPIVAKDLKAAYIRLRDWEHRLQMLYDEQTHIVPEDDEMRLRVALLSGFVNLSRFDLAVSRTLRCVNAHYGELFKTSEPLSSSFGSLVFTGIEDDPETLQTLTRLGFDEPVKVASTIRSWHHGRIAATRSERGRELFTRLVPRLLDALHDTGNPSLAFTRFSVFFSGLTAGVQIQSLFLANLKLFRKVVEIMGLSPRLAQMLSAHPTAFDAMLDAGFFEATADEIERLVIAELERSAQDLESVMNALRRVAREQQFRIGMQVLGGQLSTQSAGAAYARLADACVSPLAEVSLRDIRQQAGQLGGQVAVLALGKHGSQEMTARSDLDLMTIYLPDDPSETSDRKAWAPETYYARFTQKLIAALSAPTFEGRLYEIDMKLRPTGAQGPVAVSLAAFENYYRNEADTWEYLALTRARIVWSSSPDFADLVRIKLETILRTRRPVASTALDVLSMRALMERERPAKNMWDFKLCVGGQVDCEFAAQYLQLIYAPSGGPLRVNTLGALHAMQGVNLAPPEALEALAHGWRLQQALAQIMRVSLDANDDPRLEPEAFQRKLARAGGARRLDTLEKKLKSVRQNVRAAFETIVRP